MRRRIILGTTLLGSAFAVALATPGCGWILGLDEFVDAEPDAGGTGGQGGGCDPGTPVACYEGPDGTEGIGLCAGGSFQGTINFGAPGDDLAVVGDTDGYIAKLSSANAHMWSQSFGGQSADQCGPVAVSPDGSVVFTGASNGPVLYGGGAPQGGGGANIPLVKLNADGLHLWSRVFGDDLDQAGTALAITPIGDVILGGKVLGGVDLGSGMLSGGGGLDILFARLAP